MPDKAYTVPGTGETRYRHITSSTQQMMRQDQWNRTVRHGRIKSWMHAVANEFDTSTQLAEAAAVEFDLYSNRVLYTIPDWVFDYAAEAKTTWRLESK